MFERSNESRVTFHSFKLSSLFSDERFFDRLKIVSRQLINYFSSLNKIIFTRGKTKLDYSLDKAKLKNQIGFLNEFRQMFQFLEKKRGFIDGN